eukprot:TRINITY_DN5945_c0_g1_i8.p1 TRINITY_DN5945_c0_g1~~TRINITY_DN5945_c0_g1_i8.p1  ORF type:complete len:153 (+),score=30.24 TRINITY_DN5945_c0_g1_i8:511-969(+)
MNDFEMSLDTNSEVVECEDENMANVPVSNYNAIKIATIEELPPETPVDLIVVLLEVGELVELRTKKDQRVLLKRSLLLVDDTASVELTLWGEEATKFDKPGLIVLGIKGARVSEYGGKNLTASKSTRFEVAHRMRQKWCGEGVACLVIYSVE